MVIIQFLMELIVGIGITNPTNKLDVNGSLRATGATSLTSTLSVTGTSALASNTRCYRSNNN